MLSIEVLIGIYAVGAGLYFLRIFLKNRKDLNATIREGNEFLAANKTEEDVQTTPSGLQYLQLQEGTGTEHPKSGNRIKVHYHGTLLGGTVFDSSVDRGEPMEIGLNQVIKGWTQGLKLMVEGEKARLFIPHALGYGNRFVGPITPGSALIFEVELLEIIE